MTQLVCPLIVITRLVRVTYEHRIGQADLRSRRDRTGEAEIMGGPDKPGHDDS
jgi:hypothetical protein